MEQRLIDATPLYEEICRLDKLATDRYLDTPSNSPAITRYSAQSNERQGLKHLVEQQPTIDPVHAAGACYCEDCKCCGKHNCLSVTKTKPTDFCSYGKPRENSLPPQADREAGKGGV